jgi:hypothetical protein
MTGSVQSFSLFKRAIWARNSRKIHLAFSWVGGLALLIWGLSGLTHPIMSWTGPEQARFFPPRLNAGLHDAVPPADILQRHGIDKAIHVRILPSFDGPVLQVSEKPATPRRYFSLKTGDELADRDRSHAIWLARYYTGLADAPVAQVTFQTRFDNDYPWVNRLLPAWRIEFDTPDRRRAFIYTETNALGAQHNGTRAVWQGIFQALHNWTWLDGLPAAQLILIGGFMVALLGMAATGLAMVVSFQSRPIPDPKRRWHRRIAYAIWFPIFVLAGSGFYHLLQWQFAENTRGLREGPAKDLTPVLAMPASAWQAITRAGPANTLSLIEGPTGLLMRLERPAPDTAPAVPPAGAAGGHSHHGHGDASVTRLQRFAGRPNRGEIQYFDAKTGEQTALSEPDMARFLAQRLAGAKAEEIASVEPITRFGLGYDFRNKRLPVWQVTLTDARQRMLFIDTGANLLVDQTSRFERWETWSFSILHKWNFLRPFGPVVMDATIVTVVLLACGFTLLGFAMLIRQSRSKKRGARLSVATNPAE